MIVQFSKWGNSLAVRIPSQSLKDAGLSEGARADLTVEAGRIVLTPIAHRPRYSLDELVAGITKENLHNEFEYGPPVGNEIW